MLEHLFGSKTRLKILRLFFRDADVSYYVREISRLVEVQLNAVRRELGLLSQLGILEEYERGEQAESDGAQRKYYRLARTSLLYPELSQLLLKMQIMDEQAMIDELIRRGGAIALLLLTGRFTGAPVETDLLIVGSLKPQAIERLIAEFEERSGVTIRYTLMTQKEFFERRELGDKFLFSLFEGKHLIPVNQLEIVV